MPITTQMQTSVSQLYVAMFGRAPDAAGLNFWGDLLAGGQSMSKIADAMFGVTPARNYFPAGLNNEQIIASFYLNVLGRTADAEGLAFWTGKLNAPGATPGSVIAEMIDVIAHYNGSNAAGQTSAALFNNRSEAAEFYAEHGGSLANATSVLSGVTAAHPTVLAARLLHQQNGHGKVDAGGFTEISFGALTGDVELTNVNDGATLRLSLGSDAYSVDVQLLDGSGTDDELTVHLPSAMYNWVHLSLEGLEHLSLVGPTAGPGWNAENVYLDDAHLKSLSVDSGPGLISVYEAAIDFVDASEAGGYLDFSMKPGTRIVGSTGDDWISVRGTGGRVEGGAGDDSLIGRELVTLVGGAGADTFLLSSALSRNFTTVEDFQPGVDRLSVYGLVPKYIFNFPSNSVRGIWDPNPIVLAKGASFNAYLDAAASHQALQTGVLSWFRYGVFSYIVADNSPNATFQTGADFAVKLVGLTDLSSLIYDSNGAAFL